MPELNSNNPSSISFMIGLHGSFTGANSQQEKSQFSPSLFTPLICAQRPRRKLSGASNSLPNFMVRLQPGCASGKNAFLVSVCGSELPPGLEQISYCAPA